MKINHSTSLRFSVALMLGSVGLSPTAHTGEARSEALDFELSDGSAFVRLAALPAKTTVVNFWRSDCQPCLREIPLLAAAARQGQAHVVAIGVQPPFETANTPADVLAALQPPVQLLHAPSEPRGLLARFGNRTAALPYTVVLDAQRHPCARKTGEVTADWLSAAIYRCTHPGLS